jgi:hypothetical protein
MVMIKTNISMLRDYLKCPQLCYNAHVLKRGSARKSVALEVGTLFHEAMELRLSGRPAGLTMPSWPEVNQDSRDIWEKHKLWLPITEFIPEPEWEIKGIELALEAKVSEAVTLQGRLDGLVLWNGKFWSLQWKTYDDDLLGLQERVRLSWHEVGYQWLARQNGYEPWGGTILGACQKLPGYRLVEQDNGKKVRQEVTDAQRIAALTIHYLTRREDVQERMAGDLLEWLSAIPPTLELGGPNVIRNYDSCFGPFGRSKCPYFPVCHEGESLDSGQFVTLEDRYP